MNILEGVGAIVTGGASGLGEATVKALVGEGMRVAIFDSNAKQGRVLADSIGALFCLVDVTSAQSIESGFAEAREKHGAARVLVNCAGISLAAKIASRTRDTGEPVAGSDEIFERTIAINLVGAYRCMARAATDMLSLPPLADGERGLIINTASIAAEDGQSGQAAYAASKAGILGLMLPVARDLAAEGIRINTILPGTMDTPMLRQLPENIQQKLAAAVPFPKRGGQPAEFASLVLEFCRNAYLNAATVRLDGALRLQYR